MEVPKFVIVGLSVWAILLSILTSYLIKRNSECELMLRAFVGWGRTHDDVTKEQEAIDRLRGKL